MPWYRNDRNDSHWYEDQGNGPPIVFLHGWCMSSEVWRLQMESLSPLFRVIAPDLRGHGRSALSSDGYCFEAVAADITALFRQLDLHDTLLVGWSMGAEIAMQAFGQLRERLSGLVLVAGTPRFLAAANFPYALGRSEADGMAAKLRRNTERALKGFVGRMFAPPEMEDREAVGKISSLLDTIPVPETAVALQCLESLAEADMRHLLGAIDLPVLVVNGDQDKICLPEASGYLARHLADCRQVEFSGCGHAPFLTRSDQFDAVLIDFIRRVLESGN